jgi:hypothetical protein
MTIMYLKCPVCNECPMDIESQTGQPEHRQIHQIYRCKRCNTVLSTDTPINAFPNTEAWFATQQDILTLRKHIYQLVEQIQDLKKELCMHVVRVKNG